MASSARDRLVGSPDGNNWPRDAWLRALENTAKIGEDPFATLPALMDDLADKFGAADALLADDEYLTYRALAEQCNRYARWALAQHLKKGDVVCLLMPNRPEYMAIWLGITRIGAVVALVNTNLVGAALAHAMSIVEPKHLIVDSTLAGALAEALPRLSPRPRCWVHGRGGGALPRIDCEISDAAGGRLDPSEYQPPAISDRALCIYTSGTTGLPKAANVSHFRLMQWSRWFAGLMNTGAGDRMYNCLPMYHSIGGVVATGALLVNGGSVLIRRRFSATHFWDEVVARNCTLFQYIGELCRYLVNSPPHPLEQEHRIRLCCGNGLRADVWTRFERRFRIPRILEFYAATESNFSLYNCEGKPGAVGRVPSFLAHRQPVALIRCDQDTAEPLRDEAGFCVRCSANEVGEAIGRIVGETERPHTRFEGYTDKVATERKVLRGAFRKGDAWLRSGDLLRRDEAGFFYFIDRLGDSFRWKGENVSTAEVADFVAGGPAVLGAVVYGVDVPAVEGRAGMAAIIVGDGFDLIAFRRHLVGGLAEYARPLFLRVCEAIEATETFKPKKLQLARQGYDPVLTRDALFFDDRDRKTFVKLDEALYRRLRRGELRL